MESFLKAQGSHSFYVSLHPIPGGLTSLPLKYCPLSSLFLKAKIQSYFFNCLAVIYSFYPTCHLQHMSKITIVFICAFPESLKSPEEDENSRNMTEIQQWLIFVQQSCITRPESSPGLNHQRFSGKGKF